MKIELLNNISLIAQIMIIINSYNLLIKGTYLSILGGFAGIVFVVLIKLFIKEK
jgi:hypothetical protein